jgi:hypothetical protein
MLVKDRIDFFALPGRFAGSYVIFEMRELFLSLCSSLFLRLHVRILSTIHMYILKDIVESYFYPLL